MSERPQTLRVIFYFNQSDEDRSSRLERARQVIEPHALSPILESHRSLRHQIEEVCLIFDVLAATAMLHHAFESKLNRDYTRGGCGAAVVERVT